MVKPLEQFIGLLPRAMLEAYHPPFTFPGVDLFRPLTVNRNYETMYVCSQCVTTGAVYLDATPSLETDDFIDSLPIHQ